MPLPAKDLWNKIQKEIHGKTDQERHRILRGYLDTWHDSWKGPYWELKDRLLKLVQKLEHTEAVRSRSGQQDPFHVKRQGDAQVGLIGLPNSGKSALVYALTGAPTVIADYPFSTQHPMPGMRPCDGGVLQIVDMPPVVRGLAQGEGAGRPLLHLMGAMDLLAIVVDLSTDPLPQMETILTELASASIQPTPEPVSTELHLKGKGGIKFTGIEIPKTDQSIVYHMLADAEISHAEVAIRATFIQEELQAQIEHRKLAPSLILANKSDLPDWQEKVDQLRQAHPSYRIVAVNFLDEEHFDLLTDTMLDLLGLIRVFLLEKPSGNAPTTPFLIMRATTVLEMADRTPLRKDTPLREARVWGKSVTLPGQVVSMQHLLEQGDQVYFQI